MKNNPVMMMNGAALLLLAAVTPACAGQSSKAEIEATRQLNLQAAAALPAPPPMAVKDAAANVPDNTPPAAAPTAAIQSVQMATPATPTGAP